MIRLGLDYTGDKDKLLNVIAAALAMIEPGKIVITIDAPILGNSETMPLSEKFNGKKLQMILRERGITQVQLGIDLGAKLGQQRVLPCIVTRIINNSRLMKPVEVDAICAVLNITRDKICG